MRQKPVKTVILIAFISWLILSRVCAQDLPCIYLKPPASRALSLFPDQPPVQEDFWFGRDKILHFSFSMFIYTGTHVFQEDALKIKKPAVYSAGFTFSLGLGKEIYDQSRPPNFFSWKDMLWNGAGIGAGFVLTKATRK